MSCKQEVTCAGDEVDGVVAVLRILPELDIGVVEDVGVLAQIVEALRRQHHAHVVAPVQQRHHLQEEVRVGHLHSITNDQRCAPQAILTISKLNTVFCRQSSK